MFEYLPWSKKTFQTAIEKYKKNCFSILDIELGGMCNLNCIYCDSPDRRKVFTASKDVYRLISSNRFDWLFICGLGEPTFSDNQIELIKILKICKEHNVKCSMFSNMTNFNEELFEFVENGTLYVMFKLDSFNKKTLKEIYGNNTNIDVLQRNIDRLVSLVKINDGYTNICASIVPTKKNYTELPQIIEYCDKNEIFPLIGDLENSGNGSTLFTELKLTDEELMSVKKCIKGDYSIPVCPSVLCGIHILYDGTVAVDRFSGLSCHWFWLSEPMITKFNKIGEYELITDVENEIIQYRFNRKAHVQEKAYSLKPLVFGGCGGDVLSLLNTYLSLN